MAKRGRPTKTQSLINQLTKSNPVAPSAIDFIGGAKMVMPNYSGIKKAIRDQDAVPVPVIAHSATTGQTANDHHAQLHAASHTDGSDDIQSATNAQLGLATAAHITAIEANTTHSSSDGTDHANVVLNDTHRGGDGSDHADVAANTALAHTRLHAMNAVLDHSATPWRVFYSDGGGTINYIGLGAADTCLTSHGAAAQPTFVNTWKRRTWKGCTEMETSTNRAISTIAWPNPVHYKSLDMDDNAIYWSVQIPHDWDGATDLLCVLRFVIDQVGGAMPNDTVEWDCAMRCKQPYDNASAGGQGANGSYDITTNNARWKVHEISWPLDYNSGAEPLQAGDYVAFVFYSTMFGEPFVLNSIGVLGAWVEYRTPNPELPDGTT